MGRSGAIMIVNDSFICVSFSIIYRDFRWRLFSLKPGHGDGRFRSSSSYAFAEEFYVSGTCSQPATSLSSPSKDPRGFLGTLPSPVSSKDDMSHNRDPDQEKGLRIAWQYKKYFGENQQNFEIHKDGKCEFCNDFDLRKPLERQFLTGKHIDCVSIQDSPNLDPLRDHCAKFLSQFPRNDGGVTCAGRIAIQSLCAPQCEYSNAEWDILSFVRSLKGMVPSVNAVAVITFPPSLLSPSTSKRLQTSANFLLPSVTRLLRCIKFHRHPRYLPHNLEFFYDSTFFLLVF